MENIFNVQNKHATNSRIFKPLAYHFKYWHVQVKSATPLSFNLAHASAIPMQSVALKRNGFYILEKHPEPQVLEAVKQNTVEYKASASSTRPYEGKLTIFLKWLFALDMDGPTLR